MCIYIWYILCRGVTRGGGIDACPPRRRPKIFSWSIDWQYQSEIVQNTPNVFCLFLKSTCTFVSRFWGLRLQIPTEALSLDPAGEFRSPDLLLVPPPLANSCLRSWFCVFLCFCFLKGHHKCLSWAWYVLFKSPCFHCRAILYTDVFLNK